MEVQRVESAARGGEALRRRPVGNASDAIELVAAQMWHEVHAFAPRFGYTRSNYMHVPFQSMPETFS